LSFKEYDKKVLDKELDDFLGSVIYVAPNDTIENYQQIPEPEQEE